MNERTERLLQQIIDYAERCFSVTVFALFLVRMSYSFSIKPYNILSVISEGLVAAFIVFRRPAQTMTTRPIDWLTAFCGTFLPMMVVSGGKPLAPAVVGTVLMFGGLLLATWAKLSLRRSFGLAAANRGVVGKGPYRIVRHPMYAGYLLVHIGFLLMNPELWNLGLYMFVWALQIGRILAEERLLGLDPAYLAFSGRVRYRLAPGVF